MGKRIEKSQWEEIDKTKWQMTGYVGIDNINVRKILHDFGSTVFVVYTIVLSHRHRTTNKCFPSIQTIANECGFSKSTVEKSLTILVKAGYLDINSGKQGVSNNYYFPKEHFYEDFSNDFNQICTYRRSTPGFKKKQKETKSQYDQEYDDAPDPF